MRQLSIPQVTPSADGILRIPVVFNAVGDEVRIGFAVKYDETKYAFNYSTLGDVPIQAGQGTSRSGGWIGVSIIGNGQPLFAGSHTVYEIGLTVLDPTDTRPVIELVDPTAYDAGDYSLSINEPVTEFVMEAPQLTPIGAVIGADGGITVGHIDPVTGTVHVAAAENDGTIFGIQPIYLIAAAAVGLFLFTRN